MPIGITYNAGDLILQSVSSSGNTFQENKISAATSSLILFNSSGNLTSQSLNATTVGTSSYLSGSNIIVSSITASNISASGNISASTFVGSLTGSLFGTSSWSTNSLTASSLISGNSYTITNLTASNISASATGSFGGVGIGTTTILSRLNFPSGSTTSVNGISFGTDVNLYRSAGSTLKTDGAFSVGSSVYVPDNTGLSNASTGNNSFLRMNNAGALLTRNIGDASPALIVQQLQSGSTGDILQLKNDASTVFTVQRSGSVGIGTTSPAYLLDVSGSSRHGYRSADTHQFTGSVSISGSLNATSSWSTNALTASYVTSSNIVGTVTSASYALSASSAPTTITASWSTNALTASSLVVGNSYNITNLTASNISASGTGSFGMVGIGTTSPSGSLHISKNASNYTIEAIRITGRSLGNVVDSTSDTEGFGLYLSYNISGNRQFVFADTATSLGVRYIGNAIDGFNKTAQTRQDLTIGTDSNGAHIASALSNTQFSVNNVGGTASKIVTELKGADAQTGNYLNVSSLAGTGDILSILSSGNVGIGTTNPAALLDVSGSSRHGYRSADTHQFTGSVSISGSLNATSSWATNALTSSYVTSSNVVGTVASASYALSASFAPTTITASWATNALTASSLVVGNSYNITNLTASNIGVSNAIINGNLTVTGSIFASLFSASNIYITSSTLTVTDNIITINALNPYQRYAGLEMYDSGSGTLSSFLWDSLNNYFFISSSDAGVSRRVILGPIGEASLTENYIPLISGSNNITSSVIYQSSGLIGIGLINPVNRLDVAGNISCSVITSSFFGTSSWATNALTASYVTSSNVIGTVTSASYSLSSSFSPTTITASWATNALTASSLVVGNSYNITNLTASNISASGTLTVVGASTFGTVTATSITGALSGSSIATGNATIAGGTINGTTIGATAAASGTFGVLTAVSGALNGITIGLTSPLAGNFTTLTASNISASGNITATSFSGSHFGTSSWATNSLTASSLVVGNSYNITNLTASNISASGTGSFNMVGVGTSSPGAILEVSSSTALTIFNVKGAGGANLFTVSGSGNIGVGTTPSTSYKMQINGSFSATTKSFDIDHPVKSGKRLVYGSLESPYHGVRLTGKGKLVKGKGVIQLPDYMNALVDYDNPNVQITNIKHNKVIYVDGIDEKNNIINIAAKIPKTQLNKELEFYWTFTAVRKDVPPLQVEC